MKWNIFVGSLVLGTSLCTQSFGFDLLSRMLGARGNGCDTNCCDTKILDPSCGCETAAPCNSCAADPSCGCETAGPACNTCGPVAPNCGCEAPAACNSCAAAPSCGCETVAPSCGCETSCAPRKKPLLSLLRAIHGRLHCAADRVTSNLGQIGGCGCNSCDTGCAAAPSCGCEAPAACNTCAAAPSCAPSCGCETVASSCGCNSRPRLLGMIFKKRSTGCDIGCDTGCNACAAGPSCGCEAPAAGCSSCGQGAAPVAAPVMHNAAPLPPAPVVDPSAYLSSKRRVIQASAFSR